MNQQAHYQCLTFLNDTLYRQETSSQIHSVACNIVTAVQHRVPDATRPAIVLMEDTVFFSWDNDEWHLEAEYSPDTEGKVEWFWINRRTGDFDSSYESDHTALHETAKTIPATFRESDQ